MLLLKYVKYNSKNINFLIEDILIKEIDIFEDYCNKKSVK